MGFKKIGSLDMPKTIPSEHRVLPELHPRNCGDDHCDICQANAGCMPLANPHCDICSGIGWVHNTDAYGRTDYSDIIACTGQNCHMSELIRRTSKRATTDMVFDTFKAVSKTQKAAYKACYSFAEGKTAVCFLILCADVGRGKTHLAYAVKNLVGGDTKLITGEGLFNLMREGFRKEDATERESDLMGIDYLIIDELDFHKLPKEPQWRLSFLETIMNERYEMRKHTMVTTNSTPDEIETASPKLADRFADKIYGLRLNIDTADSKSYRRG